MSLHQRDGEHIVFVWILFGFNISVAQEQSADSNQNGRGMTLGSDVVKMFIMV